MKKIISVLAIVFILGSSFLYSQESLIPVIFTQAPAVNIMLNILLSYPDIVSVFFMPITISFSNF